MTFGAYEVFSILSGITMLLGAFIPDLSPRHRLGAVVMGGFFVIYGFYVAAQTTGTFEFPAIIFVIPFVAVGLGIWKLATRNFGSTSTFPGNSTFPPTQVESAAPPAPASVTARETRWCAGSDCHNHQVRTSNLVCQGCRRETEMAY